jgi:hypothetical protein
MATGEQYFRFPQLHLDSCHFAPLTPTEIGVRVIGTGIALIALGAARVRYLGQLSCCWLSSPIPSCRCFWADSGSRWCLPSRSWQSLAWPGPGDADVPGRFGHGCQRGSRDGGSHRTFGVGPHPVLRGVVRDHGDGREQACDVAIPNGPFLPIREAARRLQRARALRGSLEERCHHGHRRGRTLCVAALGDWSLDLSLAATPAALLLAASGWLLLCS